MAHQFINLVAALSVIMEGRFVNWIRETSTDSLRTVGELLFARRLVTSCVKTFVDMLYLPFLCTIRVHTIIQGMVIDRKVVSLMDRLAFHLHV